MRIMQLTAIAAISIAASPAIAATPAPNSQIAAALAVIQSAALSHDPTHAETLFAPDLVLISQSGKLYRKADVIADIKGGFEQWNNSDVTIRVQNDQAIVTLINSRKRPNMDGARFRVLQLWARSNGRWMMTAQSSTKIAG